MIRNTSRYGVAIAIGGAVTFGLLFVMQYMISSGNSVLSDGAQGRIVDFVRVDREETVEKKKEKPEPPPEPEVLPQIPEQAVSNSPTPLAIAMVAPPTTMNSEFGTLAFTITDGEYLPIVKPLPIYPQRAAARGMEGEVLVEYTVTATGSTRDIRVVESTSPLFERAAVDSAAKYKYRPRMIDGVAVEVSGVRTRIEFRLED